MEGVYKTVGRDVPGLGKGRHRLECLGIILNQPLVNLGEYLCVAKGEEHFPVAATAEALRVKR
jgi:hypothetical protein